MNIGKLEPDELALFFRKMGENNKLFIFCAGTYGDFLGRFFNVSGVNWEGYLDNNEELSTQTLNDKPVMSAGSIIKNDNCKYIIATLFYENIVNQLVNCGINNDNIYWNDNINLFDEIAFRLVNPSEYLKKLEKFKNLHEGGRCFIIGNGPSLTLDDLNLIKNEDAMAANKIFQLYEKTTWRPKYYFADDPYVIRTAFPTKESYKAVVAESEAAFTSTRRKMFEYRDDADMRNVFYFKTVNDLSAGHPSFSEDCSKEVFTSYSITYTMLQLAAYMGYKEIYLLGIDHNYSKEKNINGEIIENKSVKNHAQYMDDNNFNLEHIPEIGIMNLGYESAREYAQKKGITICNVTRGGKLEVFPRKKLEKVLNRE